LYTVKKEVFSPLLYQSRGVLADQPLAARLFFGYLEVFFEIMTAQEGELSEHDLLFPCQEMEGDSDDDGTENTGDKTDDGVHACGAVDDLFTLRQAAAHLVDLFLVVRTERPNGSDVALDLPQQCEYLMDVVFAHKLLTLLSLLGI